MSPHGTNLDKRRISKSPEHDTRKVAHSNRTRAAKPGKSSALDYRGSERLAERASATNARKIRSCSRTASRSSNSAGLVS